MSYLERYYDCRGLYIHIGKPGSNKYKYNKTEEGDPSLSLSLSA